MNGKKTHTAHVKTIDQSSFLDFESNPDRHELFKEKYEGISACMILSIHPIREGKLSTPGQ